jgi:hypothetical protein
MNWEDILSFTISVLMFTFFVIGSLGGIHHWFVAFGVVK